MKKFILLGLVFLVCMSYASAIETPDFAYKLDTNTANQPDSTGNYGTATVNNAVYDAITYKNVASYHYSADIDNITTPLKFNVTTAFTLIMWFNWTHDTDRIYSFWSQTDDGGTDTFYLWYDNRSGQNRWAIYLPTAGGACNINTISRPVQNAWQYLELRYNGTGLRLMINDTIIGEDSTSCSGIVNVTGYGGNGVIGGSMVAGLVTSWEGNIDEVYGWIDYAFTDSDHAEMYNSGAGKFFPWNLFQINSVTNAYNLSTINIYTATFTNSTDSVTIHTTNGTIPFVYNETLNISIYNISGSEGQYFNKSFENYLTTSFLNTYAWQSFLVYTAQEKITNRTLGSFNITIGSQFNTSNSSNETTFLLNAGTYNVTGMAQGYLWNVTDTQTLTNLQSASDVLYFSPDRLNITAKDYLTNATITNFTIQFNYNDSYYENISTTTGLVQFYGINGSYEITIYASGSYDPAAVNFTLNDTDMAYQFSLFQNNKIRLNFLEEETLLPAINITYEVYGDYFSYKGFQSSNFTDVDSLPDGIYEIRYAINSTPWMQRSYYLKIPASSSSEVNLSLLLVNTSQGYQFIRTIKDQDSLPYDGYLQIQRAYVSADNSTFIYRTVEIASIDSQGNAVFSAIPNVQPYRFRILNSELNVVDTKNSAYLVDTSSDITVQTSTSLMQGYYTASGIMMYANASYNNLTSYYILDYSDSSSSITRCCVAYKFTSAGNTSSNSACSTDYSGTIAVYIPIQNGTYLAESFCTIYGEDIPIDSELISWSPFSDNTNLFRLVGGILYILIIILCATIARFVNPLVPLFSALGATAIFSLSVLGFIYVVPYLLGGLFVVTVIVAWLVFR